MIVKELDDFASDDPREAAGRKAEEQVAFYLRRRFGSSSDILVINNLRIEDASARDAAQIDHLLVHRHGMIVIESKSVTSKVRVNKRGEWARLWNGRWQGMASPTQQARLQGSFLVRLMDDNAGQILGKLLVFQKYFGAFDIAIVVAISDSGIIEREVASLEPEVVKADQVVDVVQEVIARQRQLCRLAAKLLATDDSRVSISHDELDNLVSFLLKSHKARTVYPRPAPTEVQVSPSPPPGPTPDKQCVHCGSGNVAVTYGKYGYYLKCDACLGNTAIDLRLPEGGKGRIRKEGDKFWFVAPDGSETLYHRNGP